MIGRSKRRPVAIPNNKSMAGRANAIVDQQARSQNEKFEESLKVDGNPCYVWNSRGGHVPCSCTAAPQTAKYEEIDSITDIDQADSRPSSSDGRSFIGSDSNSRYSSYSISDSTDLSDLLVHETGSYESDDSESGSDFGDDGMGDIEDVGEEATDFDDPFQLFSGSLISCPVCLGKGYIDSWNPINGSRIVLSTSNFYNFSTKGSVDVDDGPNPTEITINSRSANVQWSVPIPRYWTTLQRVAVYHGSEPIDPKLYKWTWTNGKDTGNVSVAGLSVLNGQANALVLTLQATEPFTFTHCELIFMFAEPFYVQFPEVTQGYEQEFLDWNLRLGIEAPSIHQLSEGDYLSDARYKKVWKVSAIVRRATVSGQDFGVSAEVRALHTVERKAEHLGLFK